MEETTGLHFQSNSLNEQDAIVCNLSLRLPVCTTKIDEARTFAISKHQNQFRRNSGEPYVHHCIRVARTVAENSNNDEILVVAALLHDTLEDTQTTFSELQSEFGTKVASLVLELTNDPIELSKTSKSDYLAQKIPRLSSDALLIKLADRLDNIADTKEGDAWSGKYIEQTKRVFLQGLFGNPLVLNTPHRNILGEITRIVWAFKTDEIYLSVEKPTKDNAFAIKYGLF